MCSSMRAIAAASDFTAGRTETEILGIRGCFSENEGVAMVQSEARFWCPEERKGVVENSQWSVKSDVLDFNILVGRVSDSA